MIPQIHSKVYTVSELNSEIQAYLRQRYPVSIWVQGEIKNYNRNAHKEHIFFELCEKDPESEKIRARVTAVIFESVKSRLASLFAKVDSSFQLQDDIEVKLECAIDLYPPTGSYQLRVVGIDPTYTLGRIAQQRYAIVERLKKEGFLEKNKQLAIPKVPLRIGLITSYNSAAYHDFVHELQESRFGFSVWMADSRMQGQRLESDLCRALDLMNQREDLDVIVMIRGGGARSELAWFDSYLIGKAIAHSRHPICAGLGHEIDLSVTDLAANTYKKTPTAVAQYLVELVKEFLSQLQKKGEDILEKAKTTLQETKERGRNLQEQLQERVEHRVEQARRELMDCALGMRESHHRLIRDALLRLQTTSERIKIHAPMNLQSAEGRISASSREISQFIEAYVKGERHRLQLLEVRRDALDPVRVLDRGYTLSLNSQGKIVRRLSQVRLGDLLTTVLAEGQVSSRVTKKQRMSEGKSPLEVEEMLL